MRAVIAVLVLVSGLHAALWGLLRDEQQAPDFNGILPSVSYQPFEGSAHPDVDNVPNASVQLGASMLQTEAAPGPKRSSKVGTYSSRMNLRGFCGSPFTRTS